MQPLSPFPFTAGTKSSPDGKRPMVREYLMTLASSTFPEGTSRDSRIPRTMRELRDERPAKPKSETPFMVDKWPTFDSIIYTVVV